MLVNERNVNLWWMDQMRVKVPPNMSFRELTQNAIDAYTHNGLKGPVEWCLDRTESGFRWYLFDAACGLKPREFRSYLCTIAGSGAGEVSFRGHHGMGGKQAGLRDHPEGIRWISLKQGQISECELFVDDNGLPDFSLEGPYPPEEYEGTCPQKALKRLLKSGSGTVVVFPKDAYTSRPSPTSESVVETLGTRYWRAPEGIPLRVQFPHSDGSLRAWSVPTMEAAMNFYLEAPELSGEVTLSDGTQVIAYVLAEEPRAAKSGEGAYSRLNLYRKRANGTYASSRVLTVLDNEVYGHDARGAHRRIQAFGFRYAPRRVTLVVFPNSKDYTVDDTRSQVIPDWNSERIRSRHHSQETATLPWDLWGREFSDLLQGDPALEALRCWQESLFESQEDDDARFVEQLLASYAPRLRAATGRRGRRRRSRRRVRATVGEDGEGGESSGDGGGGGNSAGKPRSPQDTNTAEASGGESEAPLSQYLPDVVWQAFGEDDPDGPAYCAGDALYLNTEWEDWAIWRQDFSERFDLPEQSPVVDTLRRSTARALALDAWITAFLRQRELRDEHLLLALSSVWNRDSAAERLHAFRMQLTR